MGFYEKKKEASLVKDIIKDVIGKISTQPQQQQQEIIEAWQRVITKYESQHSCIAKVKDKALTVHVDAPVLLHQLNLKKKKILDQLQEAHINIEHIYFRIGKVR